MNNIFNLQNFNHVHFVGVGGVSMSALAEFSLRRGKSVSGSDRASSNLTDRLKKLGAKIYLGHAKENVYGADLVVYSSAICSSNPEIEYAILHKIPLVKRSEFLGAILTKFKHVIAVSGCHGKTTTTAMISSVLIASGRNPTVFLGGESLEYGNFRQGSNEFAVVEACEYQQNFLDLYHTLSVVLNVDKDHLECYRDFEHLQQCYVDFCSNTVKVVGVDNIKKEQLTYSAITFGTLYRARYTARNLECVGGKYSFDLYDFSYNCGRINLNIFGIHNVYNALATASVCFYYGINFSAIKVALENFKNAKRRMEEVGEICSTQAVCDYAHHPEEISKTVNALRQVGDKTLFVFQPHTYSRTKSLMNEFVDVLKQIDGLIIYKTYPAREKYDKKGGAKTLYYKVKQCNSSIKYADSKKSLGLMIKESLLGQEYKRICFLGAGDIYQVAKRLCEDKKE